MRTMAPTRTAELRKCPVRMTSAPAAAGEAHCPGQRAICARNAPAENNAAARLTSELATNAVRGMAGETVTPGIPCVRIQFRADAHDVPACLPVPADGGEPSPRDHGRAGRGTACSRYRSLAGPSGEFGEGPGIPIEPVSAGEPT